MFRYTSVALFDDDQEEFGAVGDYEKRPFRDILWLDDSVLQLQSIRRERERLEGLDG